MVFLLYVCKGGIADSVSKWVFRHDLAPERLKDLLQKKEDREGDDGRPEQMAGEEGKEKDETKEDTDRTAGQD